MGRFLVAYALRVLGVFDRFPGLVWRGRFRHPIQRWRWINHSAGRITSTTDRVGPVSRNSRTGRVRVDLPGPASYLVGGRRPRRSN
jgi:hypothetical protein